MKQILRTLLLVMIFSPIVYIANSQEVANTEKQTEPIFFENVHDYENLQRPAESEHYVTPEEINQYLGDNMPSNNGNVSAKESLSFEDDCPFYSFGYIENPPLTYVDGISISPGLNGYPTSPYGWTTGPVTITFPNPASTASIDVISFPFIGLGQIIYVYNENGTILGNMSTGFTNQFQMTLTFEAPAGESIGYFVVFNSYYPFGSVYIYGVNICADASNQAPVAIAQDVTASADANCQALVTAADIDNGSYDPDGDAISLSVSPEGPYPLGSTSVTLTVSDGDLSSTADAIVTIVDITDPVTDLAVLPDLTGECDVTVTTYPTATDNCAGVITGTTVDPLFYDQQGSYVINWSFDDGNGNVVWQTQNVIVDDVTAPVITPTANPITLWPPNHKYQTVSVAQCFTAISDNCESLSNFDVYISKVTSDEEEDANGGGDGNTTDDIVIANDCRSVDLRKERQGNGNGRVYTIHMALEDGNGNTGTATYQVHVPKNKNGAAIDDGVAYEVLGNCNSANAPISIIEEEDGFTTELNTYPNPFTNTANIDFSVNESSYTTVEIYNSMGVKVETLFEGNVNAGQWYSVKFNASSLSKGFYYCRLQSGSSISKVTKMILSK